MNPGAVGANGIDLAVVDPANIGDGFGQLTTGILQGQRHAAFFFDHARGTAGALLYHERGRKDAGKGGVGSGCRGGR